MATFVRSLPLLVFLLTVGVFAAAAALLLYASVFGRRQAERLSATPTSAIGFARDGYVELQGEVLAIDGRSIATPLAGTECVWYRARLDRFVRVKTDRTGHWKRVRDVQSHDPFLLKDHTGTCLVFPQGAQISYTDRSIWFGPTPVPPDKAPPRMLPGEPVDHRELPPDDAEARYRYTEERVYAGDRLYAVGQFTTAAWGADEQEVLTPFRPPDAAPTSPESSYHFFGVSLEPPETADDAFADGRGPAWDPREREADLLRQGAKITWRRLVDVPGEPYQLSTSEAAILDGLSQSSTLARGLGLVAAVIAGVLTWLRFA